MKEIRCSKVFVPWYLPTILEYKDRSVHIGFIPVIKFYARSLWFAIPNAIIDYHIRDCVNFVPDILDPENGKGYMMGRKIRPFMGRVLMIEENGTISYQWWKQLKRYENNQ